MKNKPKVYLLIWFFGIGYATTLQAQEVVAAGGNYHQNGASIVYTVGEVAVETYTGTNHILTQGFNQTNLTVTAINELAGLDFNILAFPNPVTTEFVTLRIEKTAGMQYQLYDINGKLLQQKQLEGTETQISFGSLPSAVYFIKVFEKEKEVKTFKIVKN